MRPERVSRVALDTSCLIGVVQGDADFKPLRSLLTKLGAGSVELVGSTALLAEFLPNHGRGDVALAHRVLQLLKRQATLIDVTPSLAGLAAEFREAYGLKTWDAIHLATAITGQADILFVRDGRFPIDTDVRGVWVSEPYDLDGDSLLSLLE